MKAGRLLFPSFELRVSVRSSCQISDFSTMIMWPPAAQQSYRVTHLGTNIHVTPLGIILTYFYLLLNTMKIDENKSILIKL